MKKNHKFSKEFEAQYFLCSKHLHKISQLSFLVPRCRGHLCSSASENDRTAGEKNPKQAWEMAIKRPQYKERGAPRAAGASGGACFHSYTRCDARGRNLQPRPQNKGQTKRSHVAWRQPLNFRRPRARSTPSRIDDLAAGDFRENINIYCAACEMRCTLR